MSVNRLMLDVNIFAKIPYRKKIPNKSTKFRSQVSLGFIFILSFYRVFGGVLSDGSSKTPQKTFRKKIVSKSFYKKSTNRFFSRFFSRFLCYHVFGRFSVRGVQKHHKKNIETTNPTVVFFWPLTHPPTT
jgi:hypothetical protein